jgi:hypothetical protein
MKTISHPLYYIEQFKNDNNFPEHLIEGINLALQCFTVDENQIKFALKFLKLYKKKRPAEKQAF